MDNPESLELYVVRNRDGEYFRAKGYGGYGKTWVKELKQARIYAKIGPARAQVSYFANHFPEYGVPELVVLTVTETSVLDETKRVEKQQIAVKKADARRKEEDAKWKLQAAEQKLQEAQNELRKLGKR